MGYGGRMSERNQRVGVNTPAIDVERCEAAA